MNFINRLFGSREPEKHASTTRIEPGIGNDRLDSSIPDSSLPPEIAPGISQQQLRQPPEELDLVSESSSLLGHGPEPYWDNLTSLFLRKPTMNGSVVSSSDGQDYSSFKPLFLLLVAALSLWAGYKMVSNVNKASHPHEVTEELSYTSDGTLSSAKPSRTLSKTSPLTTAPVITPTPVKISPVSSNQPDSPELNKIAKFQIVAFNYKSEKDRFLRHFKSTSFFSRHSSDIVFKVTHTRRGVYLVKVSLPARLEPKLRELLSSRFKIKSILQLK